MIQFRTQAAILALLTVSAATSQPLVDRLATGSPYGIFVILSNRIASRQAPSGGVTGFRLERRAVGEVAWQQVADIEAPTTIEEFRSRLAQAYPVIPDQEGIPPARVDTLWQKATATRLVDSLGFWGNTVFVRMALGVVYLDDKAKQDVDYEYRVSELDTARRASPTMLLAGGRWPKKYSFAPVMLQQKSAEDRSVTLRWVAVGQRQQPFVLVYRRAANQVGFDRIRPNRSVMLSRNRDTTFYFIRDTLVQPMQVYEYYVVPMCQYGNTGAPSDTATVATYRIQDVPLPESVRVAKVDGHAGIRLSWRLREQRPLKSIKVYRSASYDTGYVCIAELPPTAVAYMDATAEEMTTYYYSLELVGLLDEASSRSARAYGVYESSVVPGPPYALRGEGLANGVRLRWSWGDGPLAGFHVYRSKGPGEPLSKVSDLVPLADSGTVFDDTSPVLSRLYNYAYAVRAESRSHVLGVLSETVYVQPAKPTRPHEPVDLSTRVDDRQVRLFWGDLRRLERMLAGYLVYRRESPATGVPGEFVELNSGLLPAAHNSYTDTTALEGRTYEYAVRAQDAFGGLSILSVPTRVEMPWPALAPPAGLKVWPGRGGIIVSWDETMQDGITGYRLYRYERGSPPEMVAALSLDQREATDAAVRTDRLYFYYVTSTGADGRESEPGEEVSIRY
jgi:hypothetical protein